MEILIILSCKVYIIHTSIDSMNHTNTEIYIKENLLFSRMNLGSKLPVANICIACQGSPKLIIHK